MVRKLYTSQGRVSNTAAALIERSSLSAQALMKAGMRTIETMVTFRHPSS
jgi:hypothetical protein